MIEFTNEGFEQDVLKSDKPVLVDFFADWCQPCKMLAPTLEKLAKEYEGKVVIGKLVAENSSVAAKYKVDAIPRIIIFKNGEIAHDIVGLTNEAKLRKILEDVLS